MLLVPWLFLCRHHEDLCGSYCKNKPLLKGLPWNLMHISMVSRGCTIETLVIPIHQWNIATFAGELSQNLKRYYQMMNPNDIGDPWLAALCQHEVGLEWNVTTIIASIAMKLGIEIYVPLRMNCQFSWSLNVLCTPIIRSLFFCPLLRFKLTFQSTLFVLCV